MLGTEPRSSANVADVLLTMAEASEQPMDALKREEYWKISALNTETWAPVLSLFSCLCVSQCSDVILFPKSSCKPGIRVTRLLFSSCV